jgi:hypothetical protein
MLGNQRRKKIIHLKDGNALISFPEIFRQPGNRPRFGDARLSSGRADQL